MLATHCFTMSISLELNIFVLRYNLIKGAYETHKQLEVVLWLIFLLSQEIPRCYKFFFWSNAIKKSQHGTEAYATQEVHKMFSHRAIMEVSHPSEVEPTMLGPNNKNLDNNNWGGHVCLPFPSPFYLQEKNKYKEKIPAHLFVLWSSIVWTHPSTYNFPNDHGFNGYSFIELIWYE